MVFGILDGQAVYCVILSTVGHHPILTGRVSHLPTTRDAKADPATRLDWLVLILIELKIPWSSSSYLIGLVLKLADCDVLITLRPSFSSAPQTMKASSKRPYETEYIFTHGLPMSSGTKKIKRRAGSCEPCRKSKTKVRAQPISPDSNLLTVVKCDGRLPDCTACSRRKRARTKEECIYIPLSKAALPEQVVGSLKISTSHYG